MKHFACFLILITLTSTIIAAPQPPVRRHHPGTHNFPPPQDMKHNRNASIWRAFSQLSPAEQKELMTLQRTDPEKFRSVMQEKAAKIQKERQAKRKKIVELGTKIRDSKDDKEKAELRKQLHQLIKDNFNARIASMRRNIEGNKKRIARMEAELKKREENSEAIINAITDSVITGTHPVKPNAGEKTPRTRPFSGR